MLSYFHMMKQMNEITIIPLVHLFSFFFFSRNFFLPFARLPPHGASVRPHLHRARARWCPAAGMAAAPPLASTGVSPRLHRRAVLRWPDTPRRLPPATPRALSLSRQKLSFVHSGGDEARISYIFQLHPNSSHCGRG